MFYLKTFVYVLPKKSHETTCVRIILAFFNICLLCMCMRVCTDHRAYVGVQNNFQESVPSFRCGSLSSGSYESWQQVSHLTSHLTSLRVSTDISHHVLVSLCPTGYEDGLCLCTPFIFYIPILLPILPVRLCSNTKRQNTKRES